jgi:hypothetical protein
VNTGNMGLPNYYQQSMWPQMGSYGGAVKNMHEEGANWTTIVDGNREDDHRTNVIFKFEDITCTWTLGEGEQWASTSVTGFQGLSGHAKDRHCTPLKGGPVTSGMLPPITMEDYAHHPQGEACHLQGQGHHHVCIRNNPYPIIACVHTVEKISNNKVNNFA